MKQPGAPSKMQTIEFTVNLPHLMLEAANTCQHPGIDLGFKIAEGVLHRIARRAIAERDAYLLEELERIGIVNRETGRPTKRRTRRPARVRKGDTAK